MQNRRLYETSPTESGSIFKQAVSYAGNTYALEDLGGSGLEASDGS